MHTRAARPAIRSHLLYFSKRGFSLVEMLVVVVTIGIFAAIAVAVIGNMTERANATKAKRNAQNLAAVGAAAQAVGFEYTSTRKRKAVKELIAGVTGDGDFSATVFQVPHLSKPQMKEALRYLKFENTALVYKAKKQPIDPDDEIEDETPSEV